MTIRFNENDLNAANGLVQLDATGKMPVIDGSNLTNLDLPVSTLENAFDAYQVVIANSNITATSNRLYMVTGSCTINFPEGADGDRIAFLIVDNGINLTLQISGGSNDTTASRFCVNGTCYTSTGGASPTYNNEFGPTTQGTQTYSGKGKCLEFIRYRYPGLYTNWIEKSHYQVFETAGGTTLQGNWGNFDNVIVNNATTPTRYTLVYDGTDWRWRTLGQAFTTYQAANGATMNISAPTDHQYMDTLYYAIGTNIAATITQGLTVNLAALSALARNQIHYKPVVFLMINNATVATNSLSKGYPYYAVRFTDTTVGSSISKKYNFNTTPNVPYTTHNTIGIIDGAQNTSTADRLTNLGVVIAYDWDQKIWYLIKHIVKVA
jgi:hypothetical protein